eukprot:CAMPEP_0172538734 /NCGR_PEP_ID=MMETSP1067-20121228/10062_1 /TAXON_ID=265564 ORGANISM="Thalassiosira punctigera, Strain Tpunct2005C2" /NCGR_SAMPLE_ID=MMETSP1067 /ASSEMBLY_ACC=CAM_ASM_000444 /LENGTH=785 /DNA_ID=CAMNT_0013324287 /DNA_START=93 /DNA_END=2450 /DNA_ORIENTATION=+
MESCSIAVDGSEICYVVGDDSSYYHLLHNVTLVANTVVATCIAVAAYNYYIHLKIQSRSKEKNGGGSDDEKEWLMERIGGRSENQRLVDLSSKSIAASLAHVDGMEASGNFLSGIFAQMWHHTNVAVSRAIKEALEPTLRDMAVPLHFVRLDLGDVPIRTRNMFIHRVDLASSHGGTKTNQAGIQIDVDVEWNGNCDIMLQATLTKSVKVTFGVRAVKLSGRMHILLSPLTTELPIVSAVQYGFTNPPDIQLEFTGAVKSIASLGLVQSTLVSAVQSVLAGVLVLPHRMVMPVELGGYDFLDVYKPPVGMVRLTAVSGRGFTVVHKFLLKDIPDIYCKISLGASNAARPPFRTSTKNDTLKPSWRDESGDFILYDMDQKVCVDVFNDESAPMDLDDGLLGKAEISVRDLFRNEGMCELELKIQGVETGCYVTLLAELHYLSEYLQSLYSPKYEGKDQLCGLATIIVTRAFGIPIPKEDAATYVKVVYGESSENEKPFCTGTVTDYPGHDALNPMYDSVFHVPITSAMLKEDLMSACPTNETPTHLSFSKKDNRNRNDISFILIDGDGTNGTTGHGELGKIMVTHESLLKAYKHTITETRPIGDGGAKLEFQVILSGMQSEIERIEFAAAEMKRLRSPQDDDIPRSIYGGMMESKMKIRITAVRGRGFPIRKRSIKKDDVPDVYCFIRLHSGDPHETRPLNWKTCTIKDDTMPQWNYSREISDIDPAGGVLRVDVYDENKGKDMCLGSAEFSLEKLLRKRVLEMELRDGSELTNSFVTLQCIRRES